MIRPCTYILVFTLRLRKIPENLSWEIVDEGCATSRGLKWGSFSPNEVGKIVQHGKKEGKKEKTGLEGLEDNNVSYCINESGVVYD